MNQKADALSRCRDYRPEGGSDSDPQQFFRPGQWQVQLERDIVHPKVLQICQGVSVTTLQLGSYSDHTTGPYGMP